MIWFIVLFILIGISTVCTLCFVPAEHLRQYAQCPKDRVYWLAAALWHLIWIAAAIQNTVAASGSQSFILRMAGAAMVVSGFALVIWARRHNPFFIPTVVVPDYVVRTGPYRYMDHPGYYGMALGACGEFFLLGQSWAFFPTVAYLCLLIRRIKVEERLLSLNFKQ
jgi:protein-S-isoprenylcysteine O-methyltransferase Ste14